MGDNEQEFPTEGIYNLAPGELEISFSGQAVFSNRFTLAVNQAGARLSFLESHPDVAKPMHRASVFLSLVDMVALRDLLSDQITKNTRVVTPETPTSPAGEESNG